MKKWILLLVLCLLLSGCAFRRESVRDVTDPPESVEPSIPEDTEPELDWIQSVGVAWDTEGALWEIPLTVPNGLQYAFCEGLDGDLLLWSMDYHLSETTEVELCVISLVDGTVIAQREIPMPEGVSVQVLGEHVYLISSGEGKVEKLNKELETVATIHSEPMDGDWYIGSGEYIYIYNWDQNLWIRNVVTGETQSLLEGAPPIDYVTRTGETLVIHYYRSDTGAPAVTVLDLNEGLIYDPPVQKDYDLVNYRDDTWLCGIYDDGYTYTYSTDGSQPVYIETDGGLLKRMEKDHILYTNEGDTVLRLYDLQGICLSQCTLSAAAYSYSVDNCIWSDTYGGYFCLLNCYDGNYRLLFWDVSAGTKGEDLIFSPIPEDSQTDAMLKARAEEIGATYGVTILVCGDCDTEFDSFSAELADDYHAVNNALDNLEAALATYPDGFFRQLRYGSVHGIQIQLVDDLFADGEGRYGDGYIAFAQERWDYYLVVADIGDVETEDYYHEFSHIIDSYLEWDSWQREDALFSEEAWADLNPGWFPGYTEDYGEERVLQDYTSFIDSYSTISPTEDRARVMEYAMQEYGGYVFEDADILLAKLAYYSRCIRDAFDTTGWPDRLPWEQYLG